MEYLSEVEQISHKLTKLGESNWYEYEPIGPSPNIKSPFFHFEVDPIAAGNIPGGENNGVYLCGCGHNHKIHNETPVNSNSLKNFYHVTYGIWNGKRGVAANQCFKLLRCINNFYTLIEHKEVFWGKGPYILEIGFLMSRVKTESLWYAKHGTFKTYKDEFKNKYLFDMDEVWEEYTQRKINEE